MTEETKVLLPDSLQRIEECRDRLDLLHEVEVSVCEEKREALDRWEYLDEVKKTEELYGAYVSLDDAMNLIENLLEGDKL